MIAVLRLSHRLPRDARLTTHVCLTARAFGADTVYYSGNKDEKLEKNIASVVERFGGNFKVTYVKNPLKFVKECNFFKVHLTMYGLPFEKHIAKLKKKINKGILLIVGSEKVPAEYYELADLNLAIGNTPHSEVAALAIMLYELHNRKIPKLKGKLEIVPQAKGKLVKKINL